MEKLEKKRMPEIQHEKLEQLMDILDTLKFEDFEEFEFDSKKFLLQILPKSHLEEEEGGAWFAGSTYINGIDIYIVKEQSPKDRKRRMFHEVVEAKAQASGFDKETSHQYATEQEQKFFT